MAKSVEMTVGQKLRRLRDASGMSQDDLASAIGVTRQTLYAYETDRTSPRLAELLRLTKVLGVSLEIFAEQEPMPPQALAQAELHGLMRRANALMKELEQQSKTPLVDPEERQFSLYHSPSPVRERELAVSRR